MKYQLSSFMLLATAQTALSLCPYAPPNPDLLNESEAAWRRIPGEQNGFWYEAEVAGGKAGYSPPSQNTKLGVVSLHNGSGNKILICHTGYSCVALAPGQSCEEGRTVDLSYGITVPYLLHSLSVLEAKVYTGKILIDH